MRATSASTAFADSFDDGRMRFRALTILTTMALALGMLALPGLADPEMLPPPRELKVQPRPLDPPFYDKPAGAEFDKSLTKMKEERDALAADRKAAATNVGID